MFCKEKKGLILVGYCKVTAENTRLKNKNTQLNATISRIKSEIDKLTPASAENYDEHTGNQV
jgi:hypothetical protein